MCGRPKTDKMWQLAHVWNLWTKLWHQSSGFQEMQRNQSGSFVVIDVYKWVALPVVAIITNTCLLQTPHIPRQCHQQHHQCEHWAGAEATLTDLAAASLFHTINTFYIHTAICHHNLRRQDRSGGDQSVSRCCHQQLATLRSEKSALIQSINACLLLKNNYMHNDSTIKLTLCVPYFQCRLLVNLTVTEGNSNKAVSSTETTVYIKTNLQFAKHWQQPSVGDQMMRMLSFCTVDYLHWQSCHCEHNRKLWNLSKQQLCTVR